MDTTMVDSLGLGGAASGTSWNIIFDVVNFILLLLVGFSLWPKLARYIKIGKEWADVIFVLIEALLNDANIDEQERERFLKELEEAKNAGNVPSINKVKNMLLTTGALRLRKK